MNHFRRQRVEKVEANEEEPGFLGHDAVFVQRQAVSAKHRKVYPRKAGMKSRAPHDVRDIERPAVFEQRQSVACSHHSRDTLDAGVGQVPGLDTYERCGAVKHLGTCFTPDRIRNT